MPGVTLEKPILLRAEGISKRFGVTQALDDVSVAFRAGEVHALMGENGAGKSTLGKVIAGLHKQDSGAVTIYDAGTARVLRPGSIDDAFEAGIRIVHQELAQCPNLTVAENLCLHDMPRTAWWTVDRRAMNERAAKLVHRLDPGIDVAAPLGLLAPGRRQICQIAASLDERAGHGGSGPRVIVFDEPTSSLSIAEADRLLAITRQLAADGLTIIYVSHRMGEIFACCDRVSVLRDGKFVATSDIKSIDEPTLVEQMIGRRLQTPTGRIKSAGTNSSHNPSDNGGEAAALRALANGSDAPHAPPGKVLLEVDGITSPGRLENISLQVRGGEILGIGGLVGAGRSELLDAIFGLDPRSTGRVIVDGKSIATNSARAAIDAGVGYVPEDRRLQGLFFQLGVGENMLVPFMPRLAGLLGMRSLGAEKTLVKDKFVEFRVKAASAASLPGELSGGNQQKLLIARWMGKNTKVLLLDEPTRGIDVGTKSEVYKLVRAAADAGAAVLLVSSEMPELLALSDRLLVMSEGRLSGELNGNDMTQTNILRLATASENGRRPVAASA
ncbi:MAG: sugar ABC transporter ATP-binding protein [Planctomycetota bacterium]|nr:sugar ABC transporter ATP-binding protein [Planctomycetota bacterium]